MDVLTNLLRDLQIRHRLLEGKPAAGQAAEALLIHHGDWELVLYPRQTQVVVTLEILISDDNLKILRKMPAEQRERFYFGVRREMLDGRTGYTWIPAEGGRSDPKLIRLEQRVALTVANQEGAQRLLDAHQELVTIAARVVLLFKLTFDGLTAVAQTGDTGSPLDAMYH